MSHTHRVCICERHVQTLARRGPHRLNAGELLSLGSRALMKPLACSSDVKDTNIPTRLKRSEGDERKKKTFSQSVSRDLVGG